MLARAAGCMTDRGTPSVLEYAVLSNVSKKTSKLEGTSVLTSLHRSGAKALEPTKYSSKVTAVKPPSSSVMEPRLHCRAVSQLGIREDIEPETGVALPDDVGGTQRAAAALAAPEPSTEGTRGVVVGAAPAVVDPVPVPAAAPVLEGGVLVTGVGSGTKSE